VKLTPIKRVIVVEDLEDSLYDNRTSSNCGDTDEHESSPIDSDLIVVPHHTPNLDQVHTMPYYKSYDKS
jgi:hypothetical protein